MYFPGCQWTSIRPGDILPRRTISSPQELVIERLIVDGRRAIRTTSHIYTFAFGEPVCFPRRENGDTIDWFSERKIPLPTQVCVGDILPPNMNLDTLHPNLQAEYIQFVRRVYIDPSKTGYIIKTEAPGVPSETAQVRETSARYTFFFEPDEELIFPRTTHNEHRGILTRTTDTTALSQGGPYRHIGNPNLEIFFLVHPYGRGRWPSDVPEFRRPTPDETGTLIMRPPYQNAWKFFQFTGELGYHHPSDIKSNRAHSRSTGLTSPPLKYPIHRLT